MKQQKYSAQELRCMIVESKLGEVLEYLNKLFKESDHTDLLTNLLARFNADKVDRNTGTETVNELNKIRRSTLEFISRYATVPVTSFATFEKVSHEDYLKLNEILLEEHNQESNLSAIEILEKYCEIPIEVVDQVLIGTNNKLESANRWMCDKLITLITQK